jgi:hypothetical protein
MHIAGLKNSKIGYRKPGLSVPKAHSERRIPEEERKLKPIVKPGSA